MIPDEQLHQLCGVPEEPRCTSRTLTVWKPVHEQLCALLGIQWPPVIAETMVGFTAREAEVVFVAGHGWPAKEVGVWEFFDANRNMRHVAGGSWGQSPADVNCVSCGQGLLPDQTTGETGIRLALRIGGL